MKKLLMCFLLISGCSSSQLAVRDCENLGYVKDTPQFTECAERQLAMRRQAISEKRKLETSVAIEREKASHGLFGRTPICDTSSSGSGVYSQTCK